MVAKEAINSLLVGIKFLGECMMNLLIWSYKLVVGEAEELKDAVYYVNLYRFF